MGAEVTPLGRGRINGTFLAGGRVLQALNGTVFPDVERVLENLETILAHVGPTGTCPLRLLPTREGRPWMRDTAGRYWRAFAHVPGTRTVEDLATPGEARAVAGAFGRYLTALADLPVSALHVVSPGFHDTPARLETFERARRQDAQGRSRGLVALGPLLEDLSPLAPSLQGADLPLRIAHDDTKLNNVLLDARTGEPKGVIDLDTTQPGSWLADFGDMARFACNRVGEEGDPAGMSGPDLETFAALAEGFLREVGPRLTPREWERLPMAPAVIAFELGLRFLTDHLEGDRIFRVQGPDDNLRRGEVQLRLARGFHQALPELRSCVEAHRKS